MDQSEWLRAEPLNAGKGLPLLITPRKERNDLDLLQSERGWLEQQLLSAGAYVLRGFKIDTVEKFDGVTVALSESRPNFAEESSPRSQIMGAVYTSTDYPKDYPIQFHNEYSYSSRWPMKLFFCCLVAAEKGGATPIADNRRMMKRLSAKTKQRFAEKGVLYVRNFIPRVNVSWQKSFNTEDPAVVERYFKEAGVEFRWGAGGRLQTRQRGPAFARHPKTGEELWFNHALFFNVHGLEPESLREFFEAEPEDELSTHTYYGDGSPIPAEVIAELREAFQAEASRFPWQVGDVMVIDNMLTAHARDSFSGPRKVAVVMAEAHGRDAA